MSLKEEPIKMKYLKISVLLLFAAALISPLAYMQSVEGQAITEALTTDMDGRTDDIHNGFLTAAEFDAAEEEFSGVEEIADGIGL
jgi:hypothetical protein